MFETDSKITGDFIRETEEFLVNPKAKKRLVYITVFLAFAAILFIYIKIYLLAVISVAGILIFVRSLLTLKKNTLNATLKMVENGDFIYKIKFDEEEMHIKNLTTETESTVPYYTLSTMVETPEYFILFTKSWQFIPVFKDKTDCVRLKQLLKEQAPCMEIISK